LAFIVGGEFLFRINLPRFGWLRGGNRFQS